MRTQLRQTMGKRYAAEEEPGLMIPTLPYWLAPALGGGVILAALVLFVSFYIGQLERRDVHTRFTAVEQELNVLGTGFQKELQELESQLVEPTATPKSCSSAETWLETITSQERAGKWAVAATNAETALAAPGLCPEDQTLLATKAVTDGLEALFTEVFTPEDVVAQRQAVSRFQGLRRFAEKHNVPFPSSRQVAERAYQVGQFLLAKVAFEEALQAGEVSTTDQSQIQFYASTLYNLGWWWTEKGTGVVRDEGLRLLAASNQIDRKYHIGSGLAWGKLNELFGSDESGWPSPAETPLLATPEPSLPPWKR